ncbi:MAG: hypothetical protein AAFQ80_05475 [Cyanobacteria bacterium J06621_8]
MGDIPSISWRKLTGNKFVVALCRAMLSEAGYIRQQNIRRTGDDGKCLFEVEYDRDYVMEFIGRKICKPLFSIGKQGVLDLVSNAWDYCYPNTTEKATTLTE